MFFKHCASPLDSKNPQNRIITPQVVGLESVMRCCWSCLRLWWHIDQLYVLGHSRASQAEAARAYKTLLTKLQGKPGLRIMAFQTRGCVWFFCAFARRCVDVWLCVSALEGSCVTAPRGQSQKRAKRLKVGQPPAKCTTQQLHLEQSRQKVIRVTKTSLASGQQINLPIG